MKRMFFLLFVIFLTFPLYGKEKKFRQFQFTYEVQITHLNPKAKKISIWIPVPQNSSYQKIWDLKVLGLGKKDQNAKILWGREGKYGNKFLYVEFQVSARQRGPYCIALQFKGVRKLVQKIQPTPSAQKKIRKGMKKFLQSNQMVPINNPKINKRLQEALPKKVDDPFQMGKTIYNYLIDQMQYNKSGLGWGRGDAVWACDNRRGNCTDFHSLFISMMRTLKVPARFEIGFPLPTKSGTIQGYHCWGWFYVPRLGWVPVDISEADKHPEKKEFFFGGLDVNRIGFTTGRDLVLNPSPHQKFINFFIYPIVEIDGKKASFQRKFTVKDLKK